MQIFEIQEPSPPITPTKAREIAIGIDFGTTNSLVAFSIKHRPYIIDDALIPSIIADDFAVGKDGIRSIKRLIGKSLDEIQNSQEISPEIKDKISEENAVIKIQIGSRKLSIAEAISLILKHLKTKAEAHLATEVVKAVITVPAHFDDIMRNVVKHAANLAGLDVLRLISEPTAAAYAYGLENSSEGIYLVYDLGGGTFDVSLLNMRMGVFQVLASDGDVNLGGDDIDYLIASDLACSDKEAKLIKESRPSDFDHLIEPLIDRTIQITAAVAKPYMGRIKGIILVGGSTRIPLITQKLLQFGVPIFNNVDPDKVVALGAALQAENLTSRGGDLIIDIVPLSLGIGLMGGLVEKIITRNTPIPTAVTKEYTTYADNQTAMKFSVVQGEREMVENCRLLAEFELTNIPAMKAGGARIQVSFSIDADALLNVTAIEKITVTKQVIEVRPGYGIAEKDINMMLQDAYKNVEQDHHQKLLTQSISHATQEVMNVKAAIAETPQLLSEAERSEIEKLLEELMIQIRHPGNDSLRDHILLSLERLKKATHEFGERRMDFAVEQILKGKKV